MAKKKKKVSNKNMQRQQAQAKKSVQKMANPDMLAEIGEDLMEAGREKRQEFAKDVKKGLKKTAKQVSIGLQKASDSMEKLSD